MKKIILVTGIALLCLCGTKVYANTFHHYKEINDNNKNWNLVYEDELDKTETNLYPCQYQDCTIKESHIHHETNHPNYECMENCPNYSHCRNSQGHHHRHS